ncbi:hypothetical protein DPMN_141894 [Dreissena polymorpha]|uniref:Uncharacterized protein n=1 Tax=Dreissena polymorpha TaxID=45954 RepID=A0A9D4GG81_DREPO|nr:hypothetical protein DPMN_141894 [Dreissena polymorpha]
MISVQKRSTKVCNLTTDKSLGVDNVPSQLILHRKKAKSATLTEPCQKIWNEKK